MPAFVKVCQECGWELQRCPSCGDLACRCKTPWTANQRQHYDKDGKPYELAPSLRSPAAYEGPDGRESRRSEARDLVAAGATASEVANAMGVSRRTAFRYRASG